MYKEAATERSNVELERVEVVGESRCNKKSSKH